MTDDKQELKAWSEEEIQLSYKGRCISDKKELGMGYCGSCSIEIHRGQLKDPDSWASHSIIQGWIKLARPAPVEADAVKEAKAYLEWAGENKNAHFFLGMTRIVTSLITLCNQQAEEIAKMEFNSGCLYCMDNQELIQKLKEKLAELEGEL